MKFDSRFDDFFHAAFIVHRSMLIVTLRERKMLVVTRIVAIMIVRHAFLVTMIHDQ